jgi:hypothetical protein
MAAFVRLLGADSVSFAFAISILSPLITFIGARLPPNRRLPLPFEKFGGHAQKIRLEKIDSR